MLSAHHTAERAFLLPCTSALLALCGLILVASWLAETIAAPILPHDAWALGHDKTHVPAVISAPIPLHVAWTELGNRERFDTNAPGLGTLQPLNAPCDCIEAGSTVNAFPSYAPVAAAGLLQAKTQFTWIGQDRGPARRSDQLDLREALVMMAEAQRGLVVWHLECGVDRFNCGSR